MNADAISSQVFNCLTHIHSVTTKTVKLGDDQYITFLHTF